MPTTFVQAKATISKELETHAAPTLPKPASTKTTEAWTYSLSTRSLNNSLTGLHTYSPIRSERQIRVQEPALISTHTHLYVLYVFTKKKVI